MKRNETSARGASKHAPVKNAGSRRLRSLTAAAFIVMTGIGLAWHTGWGTLSSFGIGSIAEVCPLGALEAMLADRTFLPQAFFGLLVVAAVVVLFGRIFCGWVCPVPLLRRITGMRTNGPPKGGGVLFENRGLHAVCGAHPASQEERATKSRRLTGGRMPIGRDAIRARAPFGCSEAHWLLPPSSDFPSSASFVP